MKILVQWARRAPGDWEEIDSSQWRDLAASAQDRLAAVNVQGVGLTGYEFYTVEDAGFGGIFVTGWNEVDAARWAFLPIAPDPKLGGALNTRQFQWRYSRADLIDEQPAAKVLREEREGFEIETLDKFSLPATPTVRGVPVIGPSPLAFATIAVPRGEGAGWRDWGWWGRVSVQRDHGLYAPSEHTRTYYQTDTDQAAGAHNATHEHVLSTTNPDSAVGISDSGSFSQTKDSFQFATESGEPNLATWDTGDYRIQYDVTANTNCLLGPRASPDGHIAAGIASDLSSHTSPPGELQAGSNQSGTGLKLFSGSHGASANTAYRYCTCCVCQKFSSFSGWSITIDVGTADSFADNPFPSGVTATNPSPVSASFSVPAVIVTEDQIITPAAVSASFGVNFAMPQTSAMAVNDAHFFDGFEDNDATFYADGVFDGTIISTDKHGGAFCGELANGERLLSPPFLGFTDDNFWIGWHFKKAGTAAAFNIWFEIYDSSTEVARVEYDDGTWELRRNTTVVRDSHAETLPDDTWHFLRLSWTMGGAVSVFLDGVEILSWTDDQASFSIDQIGVRNFLSTDPIRIDDLYVGDDLSAPLPDSIFVVNMYPNADHSEAFWTGTPDNTDKYKNWDERETPITSDYNANTGGTLLINKSTFDGAPANEGLTRDPIRALRYTSYGKGTTAGQASICRYVRGSGSSGDGGYHNPAVADDISFGWGWAIAGAGLGSEASWTLQEVNDLIAGVDRINSAEDATVATFRVAVATMQEVLLESARAEPEAVVATFTIPAPTLIFDQTATPAAVVATFTVPAPTSLLAIFPAAVTASFTVPDVTTSTTQTTTPAAVTASFTVPDPVTSAESGTQPAAVTASFTVPAPTSLLTSLPPTVTASFTVPDPATTADIVVQPGAVVATFTVPVVSVTGEAQPDPVTATFTISSAQTNLAINVAALSATFTVPAVTTVLVASPAAVTASFTVPDASPLSDHLIQPSAVAATFTVPAPVVEGEVIPNPVVATFTIPAPTTTANVTSPAVTATFTIPAPSAAFVIYPTAVTAAFTIPAITSLFTATPAAVAIAFTIPTVTTDTGQESQPAAVTASFTIPTVTTVLTVLPAPVTASFTIPDPTASAEGQTSPTAVVATFSIPAPAIAMAIQPGTVTGAFTILAPTSLLVSSPASVVVAFTIPDPTTVQEIIAQPNAVAITFSIPAPALSGNAFPTPVVAAFTIPAVTATADIVVAVTSVTAAFAVPDIQAGLQVAPATTVATFIVPSPTTQTDILVQPTSIAATFSVPPPQITGVVSTEPASVVIAFAIPDASTRLMITPPSAPAQFALPAPSSGFRIFPAAVGATFTVIDDIGPKNVPVYTIWLRRSNFRVILDK